jgi:hypothetical protein
VLHVVLHKEGKLVVAVVDFVVVVEQHWYQRMLRVQVVVMSRLHSILNKLIVDFVVVAELR